MHPAVTSTNPFKQVLEEKNAFLRLFPHRYDFIWAERPAPGQRPSWLTESRYPLSDRHFLQGDYLYGVRFGRETNYFMIDVDIDSPYHPRQDIYAIDRLVEALDPIGIVSFLPCTSSYSGGLHLYFPFEQPQKSWNLAFAVQTLLHRAGFKVSPGQLELFPNPKLYVQGDAFALYAAHRLPLQEPGSYLLTENWDYRFTSQAEFTRLWSYVACRNDVQTDSIARIVQERRHNRRGLSQSASKFLNDLNTEIEQGWTDFGQTNRLLGRIAMRSYIFGHLLYGFDFPLTGQELIQDIIYTACHLPGYRDWCQHQHELEKRAEEWARCVENSHYFPYQLESSKPSAKTDQRSQNPWNYQQQDSARHKIIKAVQKLTQKAKLPEKVTSRFKALVAEGIGGSTLYQHKDLWHPHYIQRTSKLSNATQASAQSCSAKHKSLLVGNGRNSFPAQVSDVYVGEERSVDPVVSSHEGSLQVMQSYLLDVDHCSELSFLSLSVDSGIVWHRRWTDCPIASYLKTGGFDFSPVQSRQRHAASLVGGINSRRLGWPENVRDFEVLQIVVGAIAHQCWSGAGANLFHWLAFLVAHDP